MATPRYTTTRSLKIYGFYTRPVAHSTTSRTENLYGLSFTTVMYISRMLYLLLLSLLSPLLAGLPLLPFIWYCHQKFKTSACTSLLPFPLPLSLSYCCNAAAATLLPGAAATRLLQRGCCNTAAVSSRVYY